MGGRRGRTRVAQPRGVVHQVRALDPLDRYAHGEDGADVWNRLGSLGEVARQLACSKTTIGARRKERGKSRLQELRAHRRGQQDGRRKTRAVGVGTRYFHSSQIGHHDRERGDRGGGNEESVADVELTGSGGSATLVARTWCGVGGGHRYSRVPEPGVRTECPASAGPAVGGSTAGASTATSTPSR